MANMSYCRFHNTRLDLGDCLDALSDGEHLSRSEKRSGCLMFNEFLDFCQNNGIIDDFDAETVENLFSGEEDEENDE